MVRLGALLFACVLVLNPLVASQFFNPTTARQQFHVGELLTVRYHTKLVNYTIALWQQAMAGGWADLGPAIVRVTNGPQKQFEWQVQLYNFDLESSNIFFFWLKEGGVENLGSGKVQTMSSAYFNITDEPLPSSSSSSSVTSSSTTKSSSSALSTQSSTTDTTLPPSSTSPTSPVSEVTGGSAPDETSTTAAGVGGGAGAGDGGGALPVAAQVGIGVGVSIVGLVAITCGVLWFRYLKKQQKILADLQQRAYPQPYPQPRDATEMWTDANEMWKMQNPAVAARQQYHAEMDANLRHPVEMG